MKKDMNINDVVNEDGDFVIVNVPLHLFRHNMEQVVDIVLPKIKEGMFVVVDTDTCPYPSTEVIEVLLRMYKLYAEKNSEFRLPIVHSSANWKKVFKIVNIDSLFQYFDSIDEAKEYYSSIDL